ncbi:MAG: Fic family protein [Clostridiales bacterium]|nr:Fic family protein [Clostridiales bacterium]
MDAAVFAAMLSDKSITDYKKLMHKYSEANLKEFITLLYTNFFKPIPLRDFQERNLVYLESVMQLHQTSIRPLMSTKGKEMPYGIKAMESEIASTLTIENIDFARESVRKILSGYAPSDDSEKRIYGIKRGLEYISNPQNKITEANINELYQLAIAETLDEESRLKPGNLYRHDSVYVIGQELEHTGLPHQKLPEYMSELVEFAAGEDGMNDLIKAAAIHFYIGYLHPYFDGNGRMARLVHLWFLVQQGYSSVLFIPFSSYIEKERSSYYKVYSLTEQNAKLGGVTDITAFLAFFTERVYNKLKPEIRTEHPFEAFEKALEDGLVTEKEKDLWHFVLSAYGADEFSTKQLEKDFGNAAYATIRGFVLKFEKLGLLHAQRYSNRVKYKVNDNN